MRLVETVEEVRRGELDPVALRCSELVAEALATTTSVEQLAAALVAASWLLARWLGALVAEPEPEVLELPDERRERVLAALALQRAIAAAGAALAGVLHDHRAVLAQPARVPEPPLAPIDPAALHGALLGLGHRRAPQGVLVVPSATVRIEDVAERLLGRIAVVVRGRFGELVSGWRALEVVVGFVVALEGYAVGALDLRVEADELWVELVDQAAAGSLVARILERDGSGSGSA